MKLGIQSLEELKAYLDEGASDNGRVGVNLGLLRKLVNQRVLITVYGGVADYVADEAVDVEVFDWDNYHDSDEDEKAKMALPAHFKDLAGGCPVERQGPLDLSGEFVSDIRWNGDMYCLTVCEGNTLLYEYGHCEFEYKFTTLAEVGEPYKQWFIDTIKDRGWVVKYGVELDRKPWVVDVLCPEGDQE